MQQCYIRQSLLSVYGGFSPKTSWRPLYVIAVLYLPGVLPTDVTLKHSRLDLFSSKPHNISLLYSATHIRGLSNDEHKF
jgi:hypothetical protein